MSETSRVSDRSGHKLIPNRDHFPVGTPQSWEPWFHRNWEDWTPEWTQIQTLPPQSMSHWRSGHKNASNRMYLLTQYLELSEPINLLPTRRMFPAFCRKCLRARRLARGRGEDSDIPALLTFYYFTVPGLARTRKRCRNI